MKKNDSGTFLILAGVLILCVFTYVSCINLLPNHSSNSFLSKDDDGLTASINDVNIRNSKIVINTTEDDVYICVKQTKSKPTKNSLCWKKVEDKTSEVSVYLGKTYYVWLMDKDGNISSYIKYNTNTNEKEYE